MNPDTKKYISENKLILFLFLLWIFRLFFLQQGNEGGVIINQYVVIQIVAELGIFFCLLFGGLNLAQIFTKLPIMWFSDLYLLGMASFSWGVLPLMGCYFAFQNTIMLAALFYLAARTKDFYQLERFYIFANLFILWAFFIRTILLGEGDFHSVAYSTVAGLLFVYSVAEYDKTNRPPENLKMLRRGIIWGFIGLALTSSGGALASVAVAFFVLAMFAKHPLMKFGAFVCVCTLLIAYFSGATDWVLNILFPGKSMASIETAHGRLYLWNLILEKAAERPWLGWGYASVERILTGIYTIDAHNSIVGVLGSLGYVGCAILLMAMLSMFFFIWGKMEIIGFRGLLAACVCGLVNSNTSNFIASKASLQSLSFQMIIVLSAVYFIKWQEQKKQEKALVKTLVPQEESESK
ncbi:MAG: O-antigen ligase family protein [Lentisphaeria bacterium]|nr:O-antigen ligase family protein [Lentisphaeria bacterium]